MDILTIAATTTTIAAAIGAMVWIGRGVLRIGNRVNEFLDDWAGEPERNGVPRRKGVVERLSAIEKEVTANGGRSLKDIVFGLRTQVSALTTRLEEVAAIQSRYHPMQPVQINVNPPVTTEITESEPRGE